MISEGDGQNSRYCRDSASPETSRGSGSNLVPVGGCLGLWMTRADPICGSRLIPLLRRGSNEYERGAPPLLEIMDTGADCTVSSSTHTTSYRTYQSTRCRWQQALSRGTEQQPILRPRRNVSDAGRRVNSRRCSARSCRSPTKLRNSVQLVKLSGRRERERYEVPEKAEMWKALAGEAVSYIVTSYLLALLESAGKSEVLFRCVMRQRAKYEG